MVPRPRAAQRAEPDLLSTQAQGERSVIAGPRRYWLYASIKARRQGLLVSNDELRDHIFSLLRPRHFLKWKVRLGLGGYQ